MANKGYYILTSKKTKNILITKKYEKCFDFIVDNESIRIRTIDYKAKASILNRIEFFKSYLDATNDYTRLFIIIEKMVNEYNNKNDIIRLLGLRDDYKKFQNI